MPVFEFPPINYEEYTLMLAKDIQIHEPENKHVNVCISGGGLATLYASGPLSIIAELVKQSKIQVHHIYTTSAGAFAGIFFMFNLHNELFEEEQTITISKFIHMLNTELKCIYEEQKYIMNSWIKLVEKYIPKDFYKLCDDKLFITIHVIENFSIVQKNISKYESNEHLINTMKCCGTIPYVTVPELYTLYQKKECAVDGMFPTIVDNEHKTIYINVLRHPYPTVNRIYLLDKIYDPLLIEGLYDVHNFYKNNKSCSCLYYYTKCKDNSESESKKSRISKYIPLFIIHSVYGIALQFAIHQLLLFTNST
jgi:hypothetical protein